MATRNFHNFLEICSEEDEQSDGISIISESDRDECQEADSINSQYFWDNTHIALSNENVNLNSEKEPDVPEVKEHEDDSTEKDSPPSTTKELKVNIKKPAFLIGSKKLLFLIINLILISNIITYKVLESQHSVVLEKYQLTEDENKVLRMEINTLRKIVFMMNVDEQVSTSTTIPSEPLDQPPASDDVKIFDNNQKKFICVDVKRFVDLL